MSRDVGRHTRQFPRYEVAATVDVHGSEVVLFHKIQNISLGGIAIQSPTVEEIGTIVDLVLNFPDANRSLALRGEVVWVNREPPMDMGIRYVDVTDEQKAQLREFLSLVK